MAFILPDMSNIMEKATGYTITPDSEFFYSTSLLTDIKELYKGAGAHAYIYTRFTYDLIWPCIYLFFMVNSLGIFTKSFKRTWKICGLYLLPFIAVFFDLLENITCSLYFYSDVFMPLGNMAMIFSGLKWIVITCVFGIQTILGAHYIVRFLL